MSSADILLTNALVLPEARSEALYPGYVAVKGDMIAGVGLLSGGEAPFACAEVIDVGGDLVMPGLINAHTHASMTLFRGLADDLPLMDWLNHYIFPAEAKLTAEWVKAGALLACVEMIESGTTTFCDMYLFENAVAEAADEAGLRALVGEVLYDFPSPNYGPPDAGLRYTRDLIERWKPHDRVHIAVEPHAPYTCAPDLLRQCRQLASEENVPLIIHLAETVAETQTVRERYGCNPVQHLRDLGLFDGHLIADHVIHVDPEDLGLLAEKGVHVVHNPASNMKLASGTAPVARMLDAGINVALGTDGCASNNNLDMFREMDAAAKLQKVAALDPTVLPACDTLALATSNGAAALGLGDRVGRLQVGMAADLIVVDLHQPHLTPMYDVTSHLVYAVRGPDVVSTMVAGRWLMQDRHVLTVDVSRTMARVKEIAAEIQAVIGA